MKTAKGVHKNCQALFAKPYAHTVFAKLNSQGSFEKPMLRNGLGRLAGSGVVR